MTPPARLVAASALALIATMSAAIVAVQASHSNGRFVQVRRGNTADRVALGLSPSDADAFDWWIDEYLGPLGRGWEAHVEVVTTAEEESDATPRVWRYSIHDGPETHRDHPAAWYVVGTVAELESAA